MAQHHSSTASSTRLVPIYEDWLMIGRAPNSIGQWQLSRSLVDPLIVTSSTGGGSAPAGNQTSTVTQESMLHLPTSEEDANLPPWGKKYSFTVEWFDALNGNPPPSSLSRSGGVKSPPNQSSPSISPFPRAIKL